MIPFLDFKKNRSSYRLERGKRLVFVRIGLFQVRERSSPLPRGIAIGIKQEQVSIILVIITFRYRELIIQFSTHLIRATLEILRNLNDAVNRRRLTTGGLRQD